MADLDTLRPEVREAVACMDSCATIKPACGDGFMNETWLTIRAELLRLDAETNRLHKVACEQLRRAQKAEAGLAALQRRIAEAPKMLVVRLPYTIELRTDHSAEDASKTAALDGKMVYILTV